jgi:hypothetical protein
MEELADAAQTLVICQAESPCVCTHATITPDDQTADFRLESADAAASPLAEDTVESADAASPSATTDSEPETAVDEPFPPSCSDAGNEVLATSHVSPELMPAPVSNFGQGSEFEPEDLVSDSNEALAVARLEDEAGSNQTDEDEKSCPFVMNPLENNQEDKQNTEDPQEQEVGPIEDATDQLEAREDEAVEEAVAKEALEAEESTEDAAAYLRVRSCDEYTSVLSPIVEDVDGSRPEASEDDLMEVAGSLSEAGTPSPREEDGQKLEDPSRPHSRAEECGGSGVGGIHLALMAPPAGFADSPERLRRESSMEERQHPLPHQQQQLELDLEMSVEVVAEAEAAEAIAGDPMEDALTLQIAEVKIKVRHSNDDIA